MVKKLGEALSVNCHIHKSSVNKGTVTSAWDTTDEVSSMQTPEALGKRSTLLTNSKAHLINYISSNYRERIALEYIVNELQSFFLGVKTTWS